MNKILYPDRKTWSELLTRPQIDNSKLVELCKGVFADILTKGDIALKEYTLNFDM